MKTKYPIIIFAALAVTVLAIVFAPSLRARAIQIKDYFLTSEAESGQISAVDHTAPEVDNMLALSNQALYNIGIDVNRPEEAFITAQVSSYRKMISTPAMVIDRPGRSLVNIPSPAEGTISRIYLEPGTVISPGEKLFDLILNHEELIRCQSDLLALIRQKGTIKSELERISGVSAEILPKSRRDLEIQMGEVEQSIELQQKILILHGLSESQVADIVDSRQIIRQVTVCVPDIHEEGIGNDGEDDAVPKMLQLENLKVQKGEKVAIGDPLCQIADYSKLFIEGQVFAFDENVLHEAMKHSRTAEAVFEGHDDFREVVKDLKIRFMDNRIDPTSRTLRFYVELENQLLGGDDNDGCIHWRFKPGQRCELRVIHEEIPGCFVLPVGAVAEDNLHAYVFEETGSAEGKIVWTRKEVRIIDRTRDSIAVANDGAFFPGAKLAKRGAAQLLVALTSGGGKLQSTCPCPDHS